MKRLRYVRHAPKDGQIIGKKGLHLAQVKAPAGSYTELFYGPLYRTLQTILAAVASLGCKARVHEPIDEIGTDELFGKMVTQEFKEAVKSGLSNLEAIDKVHDAHQLRKWEKTAGIGVEKMFDLMLEGGHGLCYGHDPVIPLAARAFGLHSVRSLNELEYIDFQQDHSGEITVFFAPQ